jgi:hypothetical protein
MLFSEVALACLVVNALVLHRGAERLWPRRSLGGARTVAPA